MKNMDQEAFANKKSTLIFPTEIEISKVLNRIPLFQQASSLPFSMSLAIKSEVNKFLIDIEKNLGAEKTSKVIQSTVNVNKPIFVSKKTLIEHLCCGLLDQPYRLSFNDDIPRPAYKDKAFTLKGNIVDKNKNIVKLLEPMLFYAKLYKAEHPISQIEFTRHDEKILAGNPIIETLSGIYFRKLTIKEVSFYQPCKMYNLIIVPEDLNLIQPYVFLEIIVKTKNFKSCDLKKKIKIEELLEFEDLP
ncbi:hypothetical protein SteCoe_39231 [Stentor coeruleus]|uniref:Uncharacterized protein n=1 Tax=Stentor coeruleus TaxID=5963 RepID=A0A1R2AKQ7_9CILI|nr:hypothetical protein SteCoe_39231 [Stentor coeruleus]